MSQPKNVAILIFDNVEVLDYCGPFEVFNLAAERIEPRPFNVFTLGITGEMIATRGGMKVQPEYSLQNCPPLDILIVPGGQGTRPLIHHEALIGWIKQQSGHVEQLLSVCTGALLLAKAGVLANQPATTHHGSYELLGQLSPTTTVVTDRRYVTTGHITTSGGISAGIDMSLHIVESLLGKEAIAKIIDTMEWQWFQETVR